MVRHDDVRVARYLQVLARDALGLQHGHFLHEHAGVDDHAVADDGHGVLVHDAGRHEVQRQLLVAMHHRVACIVASLVAHDEVEFARDEVGDFTLAFVAPLGTDENRTGHRLRPFVAPALRPRHLLLQDAPGAGSSRERKAVFPAKQPSRCQGLQSRKLSIIV